MRENFSFYNTCILIFRINEAELALHNTLYNVHSYRQSLNDYGYYNI